MTRNSVTHCLAQPVKYRDVLTSEVDEPSFSICYFNCVICLCFATLHNDKSDEIPAQVAERYQHENVWHYLQNDDANEVDVSSDGDGNVNISTRAGMFFQTLN